MEYSGKLIGVINWYAEDKDFGVISTPGIQGGVFLHVSNWIDRKNRSSILCDKPIVFEIKKEKGRDVGINVSALKSASSPAARAPQQ